MQNGIDKTGDIIIYQTEDSLTKINVKLDNDTVWLDLYATKKKSIFAYQ